LLSEAETAFIDHRDVALVLEKGIVADQGDLDALMAAEAFRAFPRLQRIAFTRRNVHAPDRQELVAHLIPRVGPRLCSVSQPLYGIVDRVGAGDAFAAGILYGLGRGLDERAVLDFGLASACLKHSVVGDAGLATAEDLDAFLKGGLDIRR
jgi:2-dehydro-3-deoxygluconokinase